jgi:hypothetical protein
MNPRAALPALRLVARLHVDLLRVSSAACLPAA